MMTTRRSRRLRWLGALALGALLCAGCEPPLDASAPPTADATPDAPPTTEAAPTAPTPTPSATPTPPPAPTATPDAGSVAAPTTEAQRAAEAARQKLAELMGIDAGEIEIVSSIPAQWPDGCLGLARAGEMCTMAIVPGYHVTFRAGDRDVVARTNRRGTAVRFEGGMRRLSPGTPVSSIIVEPTPPSGSVQDK